MMLRFGLIVGMLIVVATRANAQAQAKLPHGAVALLTMPDAVSGLMFSPAGDRIAVSSKKTLLLFDASTGKELRRWTEHKAGIEAIAFSPDGKLLASGDKDGTLILWDPANAKERRRFKADGPIKTLAFNRNGKSVIAVSTDIGLEQWSVAGGLENRVEIEAKMTCPCLSPAGETFAFVTNRNDNDQWLQWLLNLRTMDFAKPIDLQATRSSAKARSSTFMPTAVAFSPDGRMFATCDYVSSAELFPLGNLIRVWETASRSEILRFGGNPIRTRLLAFSPDGKILAHGVGTRSDTMVVLRELGPVRNVYLPQPNAFGGDEHDLMPFIQPIGGHRGNITCLAFSPDGKFLATGGADKTVFIWMIEGFFTRLHEPQSEDDLSEAWAILAGGDAGRVHRLMAVLEHKPAKAIALLKPLVPAPRAPADPIKRHLADLASKDLATRQRAFAALEALGEKVSGEIEDALSHTLELETRRRLQLLQRSAARAAQNSPERVRMLRCLTLLERLRTPESRRHLESLAEGAPGAWLTIEARAALGRLPK